MSGRRKRRQTPVAETAAGAVEAPASGGPSQPEAPPAGPGRGARWLRRLPRLGAAVLSGCLVFLSFPTWDLWPLQWVSLVPLLFVLEDATPRAAAGYGWLAGFVTNAGGFYWIRPPAAEFGHLPPVASLPLTWVLAAYQGLVFLLWAWATVALRRRTRLGLYAIAPAAFVAFEWLVPFLFPGTSRTGSTASTP